MALITWTNGLDSIQIAGVAGARATEPISTGKYIWETKVTASSTTNASGVGISNETSLSPNGGVNIVYFESGVIRRNYSGGYQDTGNFPTYTINDIITIMLDLVENKLSFFKNGVFVANSPYLPSQLNVQKIYPAVFQNSGGTTGNFYGNFGAEKFLFASVNPTEWRTLLSQEYQPYDVENATWMYDTRTLIKSNNIVYTWFENEFIEVPDSSLQTFENHGLASLEGLATPTNKAIYQFQPEKLLSNGKLFSRKVFPAKWNNNIYKNKIL